MGDRYRYCCVGNLSRTKGQTLCVRNEEEQELVEVAVSSSSSFSVVS